MFFQNRLFQGATLSAETARPRQVPPTQQPSRSLATERASQPNSASDDFSKLASQRRQIITTFLFGSAVECSILEKESVSSNPPVSAFLFFFFFGMYVTSNPRLCFFAFCFCCCTVVLLLYCCTYMVGSWVVVRGWVFLLCTLCFTAAQRTAVLL